MARTVALFLLIALVACAYPRRSTSLSPVAQGTSVNAPPDVVRIQFTSAVIPPVQRSGLP